MARDEAYIKYLQAEQKRMEAHVDECEEALANERNEALLACRIFNVDMAKITLKRNKLTLAYEQRQR
jgi:hypothetical protein